VAIAVLQPNMFAASGTAILLASYVIHYVLLIIPGRILLAIIALISGA
jgi:hypothetical protein